MSDATDHRPTEDPAQEAPAAAETVAVPMDGPSVSQDPASYELTDQPTVEPIGAMPDRAMLLPNAPLADGVSRVDGAELHGIRRLELPGPIESRWARALGVLAALAVA